MRNKTYCLCNDTWPVGLRPDPGVYEIVACNEAGKPISVARIGGLDERGVLYIGQAGKLLNRLRKLKAGLFNNAKGHIAGRRYLSRPAVQKFAPKRCLGFRFVVCDDPKAKEERRLKRYIRVFGELPPLNGQAYSKEVAWLSQPEG